ncbi:DUF4062 domain-containing protein [Staphylococcus equorum]|uniref:DUF4062 domain-containing protein n=1 Tax=Staphylococcus equorum TaxID=246432 RepID=UPI0015A588CA|nr:DUF4062 domain-containing protein [Staphylococcus equorum]
MSKKPTVFISSTCYDLSDIRSQIRDTLEEDIGLEVLLSEYSSFPINPSVGTVDNCLQNVKERADIFVLIIGKRYGNTTDKGRSITNLEYLSAKEINIPIYIFVDKDVIDNLYFWKKDKDEDFSSIVENVKIFDFVEEVRDIDKKWVQEYESKNQILGYLKLQLMYLFNDSLRKRQEIIESNISEKVMENSSSIALNLILEKPLGWEYKFFFQILKEKIDLNEDAKRDFEYKVYIEKSNQLDSIEEVIEWVTYKFDKFSDYITSLKYLMNEGIKKALNEPGEVADLEFLIYIADRLSLIYLEIIKWKIDLDNSRIPKETHNLVKELYRMSDSPIEDIEIYITKSIETLKNLPSEIPDGESININLSLTLKEFDIEPFEQEIEIVKEYIK